MKKRNLSKGDVFKILCFSKKPNVCGRYLTIKDPYNKDLRQHVRFFIETEGGIISKVCGWCDVEIKEDEFAYFAGYWATHILRPCHKHCKDTYSNTEIIECQTIDADCNVCKHYERGEAIISDGSASKGICKKFNKETKAYTNICSGHACFEHRKNIK